MSGLGGMHDPFDGFFGRCGAPGYRPSDLLPGPRARRWFDIVQRGLEAGHYTYQQPVCGRSGPHVRVQDRDYLMLSSYDYLGLIGHPEIDAAAIAAVRAHGTGAGGVRLLTGTNEIHRELERELAAFKRCEAALTFSSGYLANCGAIGALTGPRDRVILDALAHRSLTDACRIARAPVQRFRHNDVADLERELVTPTTASRTLVVVEGVYSMDGDVCPLPEIVSLRQKHDFILMVDEAHSFGALGRRGRGVDEHFGIDPRDVDVWAGSLGKAIPATGGFLAGSRELIVYLQHEAAPFMFSGALCPSAAAAACAALRVIDAEEGHVARLRHVARRLRAGLAAHGFDIGRSETAVIPVIFGDESKTLDAARMLMDRGVFATPVLPPAVPAGASRLRLCAMASHSDVDIDHALDAFGILSGAQ